MEKKIEVPSVIEKLVFSLGFAVHVNEKFFISNYFNSV